MAKDDDTSPDGEALEHNGTGGGASRHEQARMIAEHAMREEALANFDRAEELYAEAMRIDPSGVETAIGQAGLPLIVAEPAQDDAEIAHISRDIAPDAAAPSRAGITDRGSGADSE